MALEDKTLTCVECGATFSFTVGEQEFHESRGFSEPRRCPACRQARKAASGGGGGGGYGGGQREMFSATCATCGREARVPFQPRGDKPVYCSDCYRPPAGRGGGGQRSGSRW